ncbi:MAG: hypothetical protein LW850_14575 [Planctomycetaceae bacterium]|jgi:hypothetical protein|nr:hypothetical protein [Planctomycetaceae bacterium]MCE2811606.1 hypothetical protein [Planctomycetaceae bacterium]
MHRLYAYQISPRRTLSHFPEAQGGAIDTSPELLKLFEELIPASKVESQSMVHLRSDDPESEPFRNQIRDHFLEICYGNDLQASIHASEIAAKLSLSMDQRSSKHSLLVIDAHELAQTRRIVLWLFPKDDVFRLQTTSKGNQLSVLDDVFSKSSTWRKAAIFFGPNTLHGFRTGRVIDIQSRKTDERAADFWLRLFLNAVYAMDSKNSTSQLVSTLKDAFESSTGPQRDQLFAAMVALPKSPNRNWSYTQIAQQYLDPAYQNSFLNLIPDMVRESSFELDPELFQTKLKFRVFETNEGVWVSCPPDQVGKTVQIDPRRSSIALAGIIKHESIRARHVQ